MRVRTLKVGFFFVLVSLCAVSANAQHTECSGDSLHTEGEKPPVEHKDGDPAKDSYCHGNPVKDSGECVWNEQSVATSVDCHTNPAGQKICIAMVNCGDYPNPQTFSCLSQTKAIAGVIGGTGQDAGKGYTACVGLVQICPNPPSEF